MECMPIVPAVGMLRGRIASLKLVWGQALVVYVFSSRCRRQSQMDLRVQGQPFLHIVPRQPGLHRSTEK